MHELSNDVKDLSSNIITAKEMKIVSEDLKQNKSDISKLSKKYADLMSGNEDLKRKKTNIYEDLKQSKKDIINLTNLKKMVEKNGVQNDLPIK